MADYNKNRVVYNTRYVYSKHFVEKHLLNELYVRKLLSVYKHTSPNVLYSDVVKCPSRSNVCSKSSLNTTGANRKLSKIVKGNDRCKNFDHNKVSMVNSHFRGVDTSGDSIVNNSSIDSQTNGAKTPNVVKQCNKVVNTNDQDCFNITDTNRFAVLYVDSSEDEGDSLDSVTVKDSLPSRNVKEFQSGRTVETYAKIGKKTSDFCAKTSPKISECLHSHQNKAKWKTMNVFNKNSSRNPQINTVVTKESHQDTMTTQVTETDVVGNSIGDKYCLDLQTKLKGEKIRVAKSAIQNQKFVTQNTPMFGFIPIYGLKGRVYDRHENNTCQNIMELHQKLRNDGRPNYVALQIPVSSKLNPQKWEKYLQNYWDWQLPLLIKYGFPIDFDRNTKICQ